MVNTTCVLQRVAWNPPSLLMRYTRRLTVQDLATGRTFDDSAHILISARGMLNNPAWPDLEGMSTYQGKVVHSAKWDEE